MLVGEKSWSRNPPYARDQNGISGFAILGEITFFIFSETFFENDRVGSEGGFHEQNSNARAECGVQRFNADG